MSSVGEPAAGSPNHFGDAEIFYHYETDLTMIVSEYRWQDSVPWDTRDAIEPNLQVPPSSTDFRNNIDPALRAIRRFVARGGK